jgi:hypothetical protein
MNNEVHHINRTLDEDLHQIRTYISQTLGLTAGSEEFQALEDRFIDCYEYYCMSFGEEIVEEYEDASLDTIDIVHDHFTSWESFNLLWHFENENQDPNSFNPRQFYITHSKEQEKEMITELEMNTQLFF